jgi:hypothetical protein
MPTARKSLGEIVPAADGSLDLSEVFEMIRQGIKIHLVETEQDNEAIAREITERTFGAETQDELWSDGETTKVENIIGLPFRMTDVKFRNSDEKYDNKLGIYVLIFGISSHGEMITVSTGSENVVKKCLKHLDLGGGDRWVKFISDQTKGGNDVYNLVGVKTPAKAVSPEQAEGF